MMCPRCKRQVHPWPLKRADVCPPSDWAHCIRNVRDILEKLDGSDVVAVSLVTGLTPEELDDLGGLP